MIRGVVAAALTFACVAFASSPAYGENYYYDALGRLRRVEHDNGRFTQYWYDNAGNRTDVRSGLTGSSDDPGPDGPPPPLPVVGGVVVVPLNGFVVIPIG